MFMFKFKLYDPRGQLFRSPRATQQKTAHRTIQKLRHSQTQQWTAQRTIHSTKVKKTYTYPRGLVSRRQDLRTEHLWMMAWMLSGGGWAGTPLEAGDKGERGAGGLGLCIAGQTLGCSCATISRASQVQVSRKETHWRWNQAGS